ncbi:MAG: MFS transporter, partial [Stellaceae bacterium]
MTLSPAARLSLFYAAYFLGSGVQLPFWPVWLAGRGLDAAEIGVLLALAQWVRVGASPALGVLADRLRDRRRFMVVLAGALVGGYALCLPAYGFAMLLLPVLLVATTGATLLALADAATLAEAARGVADYGRVRLWGTLAFIAAAFAGGRLIAGEPRDRILVLLLGAAGLAFAATAGLPRFTLPPRRTSGGLRALLSVRNLAVLAAATLIQASHA